MKKIILFALMLVMAKVSFATPSFIYGDSASNTLNSSFNSSKNLTPSSIAGGTGGSGEVIYLAHLITNNTAGNTITAVGISWQGFQFTFYGRNTFGSGPASCGDELWYLRNPSTSLAGPVVTALSISPTVGNALIRIDGFQDCNPIVPFGAYAFSSATASTLATGSLTTQYGSSLLYNQFFSVGTNNNFTIKSGQTGSSSVNSGSAPYQVRGTTCVKATSGAVVLSATANLSTVWNENIIELPAAFTPSPTATPTPSFTPSPTITMTPSPVVTDTPTPRAGNGYFIIKLRRR